MVSLSFLTYSEYTNFIHMFCPSDSPYLVLQKHSDIAVYQLTFGKPPLNEAEQESALGQLVDDVLILDCILSHNFGNIKSNIHSATSMDIADHIFFMDTHHFYKYSCATQQTQIYKDQNCVGLFVVDDKFCYTLSHSSKDKSSGLRLYDISNMLSKDTDVSCKLSNVQVGFQGHLDWNHDYSRFSILKSLD